MRFSHTSFSHHLESDPGYQQGFQAGRASFQKLAREKRAKVLHISPKEVEQLAQQAIAHVNYEIIPTYYITGFVHGFNIAGEER